MNITGELFRKLEDIDPKMRDVLLAVLDEAEARAHLGGDIIGVLVGYHFTPEVEAFAQKRYPDIRRYRTFEVEGV